jgi:hypothetical protein
VFVTLKRVPKFDYYEVGSLTYLSRVMNGMREILDKPVKIAQRMIVRTAIKTVIKK